MTAATLGFLLSVAAALATMLGWALAATRRSWPPAVFGAVLLLAAAGMIFISSTELLPSALQSGASMLTAGLWLGAGAAFVLIVHLLSHYLSASPQKPVGSVSTKVAFSGRLQRTGWIVAVSIAVHNIPEGGAPLGATLYSVQAGVVTAIAVGLHNIPEGLAVAAPVLAGGSGRRRAFWLTALATAGEILGAVIALIFADSITGAGVGILLAFVAGVMITLSLVELLPTGIRLLRPSREPQLQ